LIFEFMNPGALYPGTIGAICLLLGLYALAALPVNYAGAGLMLLGLVLMVAEAFAPSFGVLGIGGTIAFVLGATILIDTEAPGYELSWPVIAGVAAASLLLTLVIVRLAYRSMRRHVETGAVGMIGAPGEVVDWAGTHGHVYAHGERWQARGPGALEPGQMVKVVGLDGLTLEVSSATEFKHSEGDDNVVR
ncbi:MAG: NfeD family protein, partial [Gammaproteobacteria bacterium]